MSKGRKPSFKLKVGYWIIAVLSLLLLVPTWMALESDISSFRSCNINSSGLFVDACGKQSVNAGDIVIVLLFIGAICIVVSLFTHAWRSSRREGKET